MKITRLLPPKTNAEPDIPAVDQKGNRYILRDVGSDHYAEAVSTRGRCYRFWIDPQDGACCVFREEGDGRTWKQITPPPALSAAVNEILPRLSG